MLALVRELIALRRELGGDFELLDAADGVVAFRRGGATWSRSTRPASRVPRRSAGRAALGTATGALRDGELAPHAGVSSLG